MGNLLKSETFRFRVSLNNLFITNDKSKDEKSIRRDGAGGSITFFHPSTPSVMMDSEKGFSSSSSLLSHFPLFFNDEIILSMELNWIVFERFFLRGRETKDFAAIVFFVKRIRNKRQDFTL